MFKLLDKGNVDAYTASELISSDGPFESPQQFNRQNVMAQLDARLSQQDRFSAQVSHFNSSWNASGQIPERAVRTDSIGRFGAIDDTEGGTTSRSNVLVEHNRYVNERTVVKNLMYYSHYDFELFSNFTFFLNDPVNGDQILQQESRDMFGIKSQLGYSFDFGSNSGYLELGLELRNDKSIGNRLLRTLNRSIVLSSIQSGDIDERNAALYVDTDFEVGRWRFGAGLRFDHFNFGYTNDLQTFYSSEQERASVFSPKLKVSYQLSDNFQLYLGAGTGFHSNDTRVVIAQEAQEILPISYESDLGLIWKPIDRVVLNLAAWTLLLEQEFVYVGDEGVVEPSGRTRRQGLDFSMRYELYDKLFWTLDANYTYARTISEDSENNYIPLAPDLTSVSGLSWLSDKGIYGGLNVRYMDDRPANEDNSIVAEGYTVVDANIGYIWRACDFSIQVQNLLDTEWNETQFATESRLAYETQSVEEIHFTPGTPFFIKASLAIRF
jgi:outer membrane receptor protein involved in Fe transport